jgi:hypothetical protein
LEHSSLEHGDFLDRRKLPLLSEIWGRLLEHSSDADVLIYSNIDIAVQPDFYAQVREWIQQGNDAVSVTRRTIPKTYTDPAEIEAMYGEIGEEHPGDDCFIVKADTARRFRVRDVFLGVAYFDKQLLINCAAYAERFVKLRQARATFHLGDDRAWYNAKSRTVAMWNLQHLRDLLLELEAEHGHLYKHRRIWPHVRSVYREAGFELPKVRRGWTDSFKALFRPFRRAIS